MTDQELKDLVASLAVNQAKTDVKLDRLAEAQAKTDFQMAKTDAQLAKTDAQLAKTDAQLTKMMKLYGGIGKNLGHVAEEFFYNSLRAKPVLNGIHYDIIDKNITRSTSQTEREFDILLINGCEVAIIEVKHRAHPNDVDKLLKTLAPDFRVLFPHYRDYRVHLALAAFSIDEDVKNYALCSGVTVLQRKGELIETTAA